MSDIEKGLSESGKWTPEEAWENLPADPLSYKEKRLTDALSRERMADPEAAKLIRDYLMSEKNARIRELEDGTAEDPEWAAANLQWLDQIGGAIKIDLNPENADWLADFNAYHKGVADRLFELNAPLRESTAQLLFGNEEFRRNQARLLATLPDSFSPEEREREIAKVFDGLMVIGDGEELISEDLTPAEVADIKARLVELRSRNKKSGTEQHQREP